VTKVRSDFSKICDVKVGGSSFDNRNRGRSLEAKPKDEKESPLRSGEGRRARAARQGQAKKEEPREGVY